MRPSERPSHEHAFKPVADLLTVIRDDGSPDPRTDPRLSIDQVVSIYKAMIRTRLIDTRLEKLQRQGRIAFHVGSLGEEAAIIASAAAMREQDWIVPCYREVGALLWRGYPLQSYVDHMYGNADDPVHGRQMPDHTFSREHRYLCVSAPIGTQITHAVGVAWSAKHQRVDEAVAVFFGDGATSANDFHAGMNFAGVYQTPTIFLCRNNRYAISLPSSEQTATGTFAEKAAAYGIPSARVDGNDALAVWAGVKKAVDRASGGGGPSLVELLTYRLGGHSTSDDPTVYRPQEELEAWQREDPLKRLRSYLDHFAAWDDSLESDWKAVVGAELKECITVAENKPAPELSTMFSDVYAEQPQHLKEQEAECVKGPRADKGHGHG